MQRTIVEPPEAGSAALAELKHWLGVTRADDDAALSGLIDASVTMCEAFTGRAPIRQVVEEQVALLAAWHELVSRPVRGLGSAELVAEDGSRTVLAETDFAFAIGATGSACVRALAPLEGRAMALTLEVGIAATWDDLPAPLAQGIIRLAAHYHRDRDTKSAAIPPASVTALWRPWRAVRL
jgi:uncharacterized phiE125 gp8 family phage protein